MATRFVPLGRAGEFALNILMNFFGLKKKAITMVTTYPILYRL